MPAPTAPTAPTPPVQAQPAHPPTQCADAQAVPVMVRPAGRVLPHAVSAGINVNFSGNVSAGSHIEFVSHAAYM
eukprot:4925636-Pleurochrysis_carterae.AAC.1